MRNKLLIITFGISLFACETSTEELIQLEEPVEATSAEEDLAEYAELGFKYATSTKAVLGKNLSNELLKGGPEQALLFCNTHALPLTDSMSVAQNSTIKRASDKPRNPSNRANAMELEQIQYYKEQVAAGKTGSAIQPNVKIIDEKVHVFYPILTNEMCLQCHGIKEEVVSPSTLAAISSLYPEDEATGYQDNEVRGVWNVIFDK